MSNILIQENLSNADKSISLMIKLKKTEKQIDMKSVDITIVFLNFLEDRINLFFKLIEIANAKCFPF